MIAVATDPDGDALHYQWSGCASGTAMRATCTVDRSGPVTASVDVSDGQGHVVRATAHGEGVEAPNAPPTVAVAFDGPSTCVQDGSHPCFLRVRAVASDPDGDELTYAWSGCASGTLPEATCTVPQVGQVVARVDVSDGHEHTITASLAGEGTPRPNEAPRVAIRFEGPSSCTPLPDRPCSLEVLAEIEDPDDDPVSHRWSGCASGSSTRATCVVSRPGTVTASIEVSDGRGAPTRAEVEAEGDNRPPDLHIGSVALFPSGSIEILGNVQDPDEGFICGRQYCGEAVASGACTVLRLECTCLAGLELYLSRTASAGACTVTFSLRDSWNAIGRPAISFDVSNPQAWRREPRQ